MRRSQIWLKWPYEEIPPWASVWPLAVGFQSCAKPIANAVGDYYCLHLVVGGRTRLRTDPGTDALLKPGDMFATWPGVPFTYHDESPRGQESWVYWVRLAGHLAREFVVTMGFTPEQPYLTADRPPRVQVCFRRLMHRAAHYTDSADVEAVAILHGMAAHCRHPGHRPPRRRSLAQRLRQFMETELHRGLNVEQISRAFGISRSTLFLHIRREYRKSPVALLIELRLAQARKLLEETVQPVSQVAGACGYADFAHFTHQFHDHVGCPPSEYRRRRVKRMGMVGDQ